MFKKTVVSPTVFFAFNSKIAICVFIKYFSLSKLYYVRNFVKILDKAGGGLIIDVRRKKEMRRDGNQREQMSKLRGGFGYG